jgi:hypothetical protein
MIIGEVQVRNRGKQRIKRKNIARLTGVGRIPMLSVES